MITARTRVKGTKRFIKKANRVQNADKFFFAIHQNHVKRLEKRLSDKPYPAKLPNQQYQRTGKLKRSYSWANVDKNTWRIKNSRQGSLYVADRVKQASIHRGRWYTVEGEEKALRPKLEDAYRRKINRHFAD